MAFDVDIDGLKPGIQFEAQTLFGAPKLLVDGQPAPKAPTRGKVLLPSLNGSQVEARLYPGFTQTTVEIDGVKHPVGPKVPFALMLVAALPLGLIAVGGLLGGLCGGLAFGLNSSVARSDRSTVAKVAIMLALGMLAGGLFFAIAIPINIALGR